MARQTLESAAVDGDEAKPVDPNDPTFLAVQKKVRRLMLLGGGTLGLGILAVLAAIIYRIMTMDATPAPAIAATGAPGTAVPTLSASALGLPADAKLISTAMDGNRLALTYAVGASTETIVVDTRTNAVVNILRMAP